MTAIAALTEDFNGAAAGVDVATSNSIADALVGAGTAKFNADAYTTGVKSAEFVGAAALRYMRCDHPAALGWRGFALKIIALPTSNESIAAWYNGAAAGGDIRLRTDGSLEIRDAGFVSRGASGAVLALNTWYYVTVKVTNGASQFKIWQGGTLVETITPSNQSGFTQTTLDSIRLGLVGSNTATIRMARFRGDDATEPSSGVSNPNPIAVVSGTTKQTKVATTGANGTLVVTQLTGPTAAAISGPDGSGVFTISHPSPFTTPMTFQLKATDQGVDATTNFTISPDGAVNQMLVYNGATGQYE